MSKRKPGKPAKRRPTIAKRALGNKQAIVKSAIDNLLGSVAPGPIESPVELHDDSNEKLSVMKRGSRRRETRAGRL
jgi:hypothetical protein